MNTHLHAHTHLMHIIFTQLKVNSNHAAFFFLHLGTHPLCVFSLGTETQIYTCTQNEAALLMLGVES